MRTIAGKPVLRGPLLRNRLLPNRAIEAYITKDSLNQACCSTPECLSELLAAVSSGNRTLYTYMGTLLPRFGNVTYSSAGS